MGSQENQSFREVHEKPICRGDCLKRGLGQFADLRGGLARKRGWCYSNVHYERYKVFQEFNISSESIFLIYHQSKTFLLISIIKIFSLNHNCRIVQKKISAEKFNINIFTFKSSINK